MNPSDPNDAQQIVIEYARMLERDVNEGRHPARIDSLPYAKPIIKSAICTSVRHLAATGRLTDDLREFLENAYTLLAEYIDAELVELMTEYRSSAERLVDKSPWTRDKTQTDDWQVLVASGSLAGEVARTMTTEAETLRTEFRSVLAAV